MSAWRGERNNINVARKYIEIEISIVCGGVACKQQRRNKLNINIVVMTSAARSGKQHGGRKMTSRRMAQRSRHGAAS